MQNPSIPRIDIQSFDLFNRIAQIHQQPQAAPENLRAKYILLYKVLEQACYELTARVTFSFANLFSRLDYICKEKKMTPSDKYAIQTMRRNCNAALRDDFRPDMEEYLYDLRADPAETRNLIHSKEHREVKARLRKMLIDLAHRAGEPPFVVRGRLIAPKR